MIIQFTKSITNIHETDTLQLIIKVHIAGQQYPPHTHHRTIEMPHMRDLTITHTYTSPGKPIYRKSSIAMHVYSSSLCLESRN